MEKEVELLSRVAANHLYLGQFEALRAVLLSLWKREPEIAWAFLNKVVFEGGRLDGVLWSDSCRSPSHLAWMCVLELLEFGEASSFRGLDPEAVRLKVEFLLLVQILCSRALEMLRERSADPNVDDGDGDPRGCSASVDLLNEVLELGLRRLKCEVADVLDGPVSTDFSPSDEELKCLYAIFLDQAKVVDALCWNIQKQVHLSKPSGSELTVFVAGDVCGGSLSTNEGLDALGGIQRSVQMAHLGALELCLEADDVSGAISHIRFLHPGFGLEDSYYRMALNSLIKKTWSHEEHSGGEQYRNPDLMLLYAESLSTGCMHMAHMIEVIQDELRREEIEQSKVSDDDFVPLPLRRYLEDPHSKENATHEAKVLKNVAVRSCMEDMYHFARISGKHVLECVVDTALSFVKREQLQEASDVLSIFPLLRPLVAVMAWDLVPGKTEVRRKLMQVLWTSQSQALRLEESSIYRKQSDDVSCVEHMCDLLCFHLDLASFVACVNAGGHRDSRFSLLLSGTSHTFADNIAGHGDPFVENFVLERLAAQTPLRVMFDVVPRIKFKDAIELISMQPIPSGSAAWKRLSDVELMHMRYALESTVLALGIMEKCTVDNSKNEYYVAMMHLKDLKNHLEALSNVPRKVFMLNIIVSLLRMDDLSTSLPQCPSPSSSSASQELPEFSYFGGSGNTMVVSFTQMLLEILQNTLPSNVPELEGSGRVTTTAKQALEWRISNVRSFTEDWRWRLSILDCLLPLSTHPWSWKEALAILGAAPSKLLNLCMQRAKYDIGEEAVHRFSLPAEDRATLELAEWVAGAVKKVSVEDAISRVAEGSSNAVQELDFSAFRAQLGHMRAILLCVDVAATLAKSKDMCKLLLDEARAMLSDIYPGVSPKNGLSYWDQIREITIISVTRRVLQCLHDLLEEENCPVLQSTFSGSMISPVGPVLQVQRRDTLSILHQMIDDAYRGKRQFLSGKLHNLARVVADEVADDGYLKGKGVVLGLGLNTLVTNSFPSSDSDGPAGYDMKDSGKRFFGPLSLKPSTYLSAFIIYIATIGDIVDGIDTTHDFNFFTLIYEWPKDLLTHLVFERGSTDAAGKVADIMCVDFVHEVISACVPPVFPPRSGHGWASIPALPSFSRMTPVVRPSFPSHKEAKASSYCSAVVSPLSSLYPLNLDIVKHLAKLSPVRAILACVFGSSILYRSNESSSSFSNGALLQEPDAERLFYEFALDQSERFPTLNRWIQMQSNLHRVSESAIAATNDNVVSSTLEYQTSYKRFREPEHDAEPEVNEIDVSKLDSTTLHDFHDEEDAASNSERKCSRLFDADLDRMVCISLDWEDEGPYEKAVERLINDGKLVDALALSDRCLRDGASDRLLQLLIEHEEKNFNSSGYPQGFGAHNSSNSWKYCLRLRDKYLAAVLTLKYLHRWELDAAINVLVMCSCHLPQNDPIANDVLHARQSLQRYKHILCADDHYSSWQEVEADCKEDPEGLALRLAGKGAVSAALKVAESASLSTDLRRELQGRQLVKLLTTDPLSGGGPAEASRFLSSLVDPDDAMPVAVSAMQLLPDLRSKQLLVHFFLKRRAGKLSDCEITRLNSWAMGLHVLAILPPPWQQRCSALHEHPHLILEVLLMMKQLNYVSMILKRFNSLCDDKLVLTYAAKAISVNVIATPRESRVSVSRTRSKQKVKTSMLSRSNFTNSLSNLQREARRAFSWAPRVTVNKNAPKDRKRKGSGLLPSGRVSPEGMAGIQEERTSAGSADAQERPQFVSVTEEWVLTGDPNKDTAVRSSHRYDSSPDIILFKEILSLCSDELIAAKGALELCVSQMKCVLSSQQLPLHSSVEAISRAYHATETFVQALSYAKYQLRQLSGNTELLSNFESKDTDDASVDTGSSGGGSPFPDELSELTAQANFWLGHAELLQSLLGSGIVASLDDIADKESSAHLCDRLIKDERYSMAIYTCKKCKINAFPVWKAWGHALIRMEHYAQARVKFKQALQLCKEDPTLVILDIVNTIESEPPVDVLAVRSLYEHLSESASIILDDSLSADSYLSILYVPSTFPRSERCRQSQSASNDQPFFSILEFDEGSMSNLDSVRYAECIHYLQEYARPHMLNFMFRHGHYSDACSLFFPPNTVPSPPQPSSATTASSASTQRPDPLATDYGTIDDLCELCIAYGVVSALDDVVSERVTSVSQDPVVNQYTTTALARICNYFETHRHFNFLYRFQVIRGDHVAAGLCCIQLFMNSAAQEEAVRHLDHAKMHFEEGLSARHRAGEMTKLPSKTARGKSASEKLSEEGLVKYSARVAIQVEVVRAFSGTNKHPWKHSLFGNPNDSETFRRRCEVAETLAEKNFDLAFRVIYEFNLPAVDIYAAVGASLAERKRGSQLTEFLRNVKGTIDEEDMDQVLSAAINVYANKHKERPDRLIDMLTSNHRKVLACVICGRLKSAFQIASRSGSVADVQYVAHQALHANALPVLDMCKQWLAQCM